MTPPDRTSVRAALRAAVTQAMKARDREALAAYRTTLAAMDNAEAVPLGESDRAGAVEASSVGVGSTDADRRSLTERELTEIVRREAQDRRAAADELIGANAEASRRLHREANLLLAVLGRPESTDGPLN